MWTQPHLLDLARLSRAEIEHLLLEARGLGAGPIASSALDGHTVATLFFEPSTRTRSSFEIAATRLGATVLNLNLATSSTSKGETLLDTVANVQAMGVSALVVRHPVSGTPELIAKQCAASVINAGDGRHEHPTQGLLDALTILEKKGRIEGLVVTLAGDILNSRVARSNIHLLGKFGARVRLVAPRTLLPRDIEKMGSHLTVHDRFDEALTDADVVMMLRVQSERLNEASFPSRAEYHRLFGLTEARMKLAKPDAIVMHPGPMNRGVEIASAVADGPQSVILEQVKLGVRVRMAVLSGVISANGALSGSRTKSAGGHA